jgi:hypothetical protein
MFDKATFVVDREQIVLQLQTFFSACKVRRSFEIAKVPVYGNTGCRVFNEGRQNWKDFCLKINKPKENY